MSDLTHVKGLAELQKLLDTLPAKLEANVMRGALRAGSKVILDEARRLVPVALPNQKNQLFYGGRTGALRDSLRITTKIKGGKVTASVKAGGKRKGADVYYAKWVEFGTAAHTISSKRGMAFGGGVHKSVQHPGAKPHPFLRPALDGRAQEATVAAAEYMKKRLSTKEGLDTADIEIEVES